MGLVNLIAVPSDADAWKEFWFNNWIDHQTIQQAIAKQKGINQTVYAIDPWQDQDKGGILQRHQLYHNEMNIVIGLGGSDLSYLDFNDKNFMKGWVYQHYQEHLSARQVLKL